MLECLLTAAAKGSSEDTITFSDDEDVFKNPPVIDSIPAFRAMLSAEDVSSIF
jgi:hypothetical protein